MENNFEITLGSFVCYCQNMLNEHYAKNLPNLKPDHLEVKLNRKYAKICCVNVNGAGRSAWAFIDRATGDILKPASWNTPAKIARGNIYKPETWTTVTVYGPQYLR